jgi:hypothetical protein
MLAYLSLHCDFLLVKGCYQVKWQIISIAKYLHRGGVKECLVDVFQFILWNVITVFEMGGLGGIDL